MQASRKVHFEDEAAAGGSDTASEASEISLGDGVPAVSGKQRPAATPFSHGSLHTNGAFSPCSDGSTPSGGGWKIEAVGTSSPAKSSDYTPSTVTLLASVQRVDDLRHRLDQLEQTLKDMESRAVEQLDQQLQEKVLVTALKLVQQRCLVEGVLDRQVQEELLQTARQAVEAAAQQRQAEGEGQAGQEKDGEAGRLARRLEFAPGDGGVASGAGGGAGAEELLERFASHIEQGLGESLRRVERKADVATALLDQGAVEMLEARLAKGLGPLEARVAALEVQGPAPGGLGQEVLAARMEALESAVRDQQNALLELLAALRKGASQQTQGAPPRTQPAAQSAIPKAPASPKGAGTNVPTTTYPAAAKDARVSSSAPLPKLRQLRGASAAQQVALEVAKAQVRNASVQPEQEEAQPLLLTIVSVVFWVFVALLGMAALALGAVAIAVRNGMTFP